MCRACGSPEQRAVRGIGASSGATGGWLPGQGRASNVVEQTDAIVRPVRDTGWQTSQPGDREVRRQLRLSLKNNGLPPQGDLFDRAYAYIAEHY